MLDKIIVGAKVVDGSGKPAEEKTVGIRNGKIVLKIQEQEEAKEVIDGRGLYLCPGLIDSHSHSDRFIGGDPNVMALCKISQGITTEVVGQCGSTSFPIPKENRERGAAFLAGESNKEQIENAEEFESFETFQAYAKRQKLTVNYAFLQGHSMLRMAVLGYENRKATAEELEKMKGLLKDAMEHGCLGLSSGLIYVPGVYADTEELIELCKVIRPYGGIYATHMRSESDHIVEAVKEAITIAKEAGVPLVISHHKVCGVKNWGASKKTLQLIEDAIKEGVQITMDQYPYQASQTGLCQCMPPKYFSDGLSGVAKLLEDPGMREQIRKEMMEYPSSYNNSLQNAGGFGGILVLSGDGDPSAIGKYLDEYAKEQGKDPYDAYFDLMIANKGMGNGAFFCMQEEELDEIYLNENTVVGSDGLNGSNEGAVHPRAFGALVRAICYFHKKKGLVSFEEAIRKETSLTAGRWGLQGKGLIAEGMDADLVLMDYDALEDKADFIHQRDLCEGIEKVFVNGVLAYEKKQLTGNYAGQILLRTTKNS